MYYKEVDKRYREAIDMYEDFEGWTFYVPSFIMRT